MSTFYFLSYIKNFCLSNMFLPSQIYDGVLVLEFTENEEKKKESEVTQSCLTLCNPMDCSLPGSSVHGIFQARALDLGAIAFS